MLFNSILFLFIFLPFTFIFANISKKIETKNFLLLILSFIFFSYAEPIFSVYVILTTILDFYLAKYFHTKKKYKKILLIFGITYNLLILFLYKYLGFLSDLINIQLTFFVDQFIPIKFLILPLGISFITFTKISFLVDNFKNTTEKPKKIIDVLLYIFLFPQLIAGPIIRYSEINKQFINRNINKKKIIFGIKILIIGLAKKVLLADQISYISDDIFSQSINSLSILLLFLGCLAFTLQIYFDFSGYSDMAIGMGKMLGFSFPKNFNHPYLSYSVTEFWQRWHITLSKWFKNYLYIPLGGNKNGKLLQFRNLSLVFVLSGLWHGASLNFLIWGVFNGVFLLLEKQFKLNLFLKKNFFSKIYFLFFILNSWLIFRIEDTDKLLSIYKSIFKLKILNDFEYLFISGYDIFLLLLCFSVTFFNLNKLTYLIKKKIIFIQKKGFLKFILEIYIFSLLLLSTLFIISDKSNQFLYFRF